MKSSGTPGGRYPSRRSGIPARHSRRDGIFPAPIMEPITRIKRACPELAEGSPFRRAGGIPHCQRRGISVAGRGTPSGAGYGLNQSTHNLKRTAICYRFNNLAHLGRYLVRQKMLCNFRRIKRDPIHVLTPLRESSHNILPAVNCNSGR